YCGDLVQMLVFVRIDEDIAADRISEAAARDLARLVRGIAVGQNRDLAQVAQRGERVERTRVNVVVVRKGHQQFRQRDLSRVVWTSRNVKARQGQRITHDAGGATH